MTSTNALPAVASRTYSDCKKCGCERFHVVVAHTSPTAAKIECEVCHAKKTLKVGAPKKPKKPSKSKSSASPVTRWDDVKSLVSEKDQKNYNMKTAFTLHNTINHPKFGVGVVTAVQGHSMEVAFPDGTRSLVHSRV